MTPAHLDTARRLMADDGLSLAEIAPRIGVGRTTLYRALDRAAGRTPRRRGRKPTAEGRAMPIRREVRWLYPIDWRELSIAIRFGRAGGRCEGCGRPHGRLVVPRQSR